MQPNDVFLQSNAKEVRSYLSALGKYSPRGSSSGPLHACKLCPKKTFTQKLFLVKHVKKFHTKRTNYVPEGCLKQHRISKALYEDDLFSSGIQSQDYLSRAAELLREQVGEETFKDARLRAVDEECRIVLDGSGPCFRSLGAIAEMDVRRVGNFYYTRSFAQHLYDDFVIENGKLDKVRNRFAYRAQTSGNTLASMLPDEWQDLVADVFYSGSVQQQLTGL